MAKNILDLLDEFEPRVRLAFIEAIQEITSKVRIADVVRALERGDTQAAIDLLYIDGAAYRAFERALGEAYEESGAEKIEELGVLRDVSGIVFILRFNPVTSRAIAFMQKHSELNKKIFIEDQKTILGRQIRRLIADGDKPSVISKKILGHLNHITRKREGGTLGLSEQQISSIDAARKELKYGNFALFKKRTSRDKRFDSILDNARKRGIDLSDHEIEKMLLRYSDGLLKLRAKVQARTSLTTFLNESQHEALIQLVETGKVKEEQITRKWISREDERVRNSHVFANGQTTSLHGLFYVGYELMKYPGDISAGVENIINCRCIVRHSIKR